MKKLDLNIKLRKPVKDDATLDFRREVNTLLSELGKPERYILDEDTDLEPCKLAKKWIGIMVEKAMNKPDPRTGRATINSGMDAQRQYFKVMDALDTGKNGVVEMEDEVFGFMDRKFHQAEMPVQKNISEVLVRLDDAINLAKVEKSDKKE